MSQAVISNNQSIKINRAISGTTTVNANCYAIITYIYSSSTAIAGPLVTPGSYEINKYFGPGQSIPATMSFLYYTDNGYNGNNIFTISSGVEFINSP
jgi:hypothetical protein